MKYLTTIISIFIFLNSYAQKFSGQVIDNTNNEPISYVNIGVLGKNIGTVSDKDGRFQLELNDKFNNDTLRLSRIGYESLNFKISDYKNKFTNGGSDRIKLMTKIYKISEVVVRPKKTKTFTLGNFCKSTSCYGDAFYSRELGTEIGVVMQLPNRMKKAYLKSFRFYVTEFTYDKFPMRLNIYNLKNGLPENNILKEPIFIDITSTGEYVIDLKKYDIITNDDFFVSLEYYRVANEKEGKLVFCADPRGEISFNRQISQGDWGRLYQGRGSAELGFSVIVVCEK